MYVLETRNTVGGYIAKVFNDKLNMIEEVFDDIVNQYDLNDKTIVTELTNEQKKKYPDVIKYFKIGGSHWNFSMRIRKVC